MIVHSISVSPTSLHPNTPVLIFSKIGEHVNLLFSIQAFPKPTSINCTLLNLNNKLTILDIGTDANLPESLVTYDNDVFNFTLMFDISEMDDYGEYTCRISNGIGDSLDLSYTVKEHGTCEQLAC